MIGRAIPYVAALFTAAALVAGGVIVAGPTDETGASLPRFADDPEFAWEIEVDDAEWAVGDGRNVYVAEPWTSDGRLSISVRDRQTGDLVRRLSTVRPAGDSLYFRRAVDGMIMVEFCTEDPPTSLECELRASDAMTGRTLWTRDTSDTGIGIVGTLVVLSTERRLGLLDLRSGEELGSISGGAVRAEFGRSEITVRTGQDVKVFRLPDLSAPIVEARFIGSVYGVVGDDLVVSEGRSLLVTDAGGLVDVEVFESDIEWIEAAADDIALVSTANGETSAVDLARSDRGKTIWTSDAGAYGLVGASGSAVFSFDGDDPVRLLDRRTGETIARSESSEFYLAEGGVVFVEEDRVWGFGYEEQEEVWSVEGVSASNFQLVDGGFVTIETDGTVRLYR